MIQDRETDADIALRHLPYRVRDQIERDALDRARDEQRDRWPAVREILVEEDVSVSLEFDEDDEGRPTLRAVPEQDELDEDVRKLAEGFGDMVASIAREEVMRLQNETGLSPREFVVLVLMSAGISEEEASDLMSISTGNYRGKKADVREKIQRSDQTMQLVQKLR